MWSEHEFLLLLARAQTATVAYGEEPFEKMPSPALKEIEEHLKEALQIVLVERSEKESLYAPTRRTTKKKPLKKKPR